MAIRGVTQQVKLSGGDPVNSRVDSWLWLFLNQEGVKFPVHIFGGANMRHDMSSYVLTKNRIEWLVQYELEKCLLPQKRLAWITEEKRQINWLLLYIQNKLRCNIVFVPPRLLGRDLVIASLDIWKKELGDKAFAVEQMARDWNQHKQGDRIFKWFKEKDEVGRCGLAWNWLVEKKSHFIYGEAPISSYENLLMIFDHLQMSEAEKKIDVDAIKKRWSQQQYRKKNTGKKQCNFLLSNQSLDKLEKLAVKYDVSRAKVLDVLIQRESERGVYLPGEVKVTSFL